MKTAPFQCGVWFASGIASPGQLIADRPSRREHPTDPDALRTGAWWLGEANVQWERPDELVTHNAVTSSGRYGTDDSRMSYPQTGAVRTFAVSSRSAAATGSSIPSFRPNRMASSRMRAAISQIFRSAPGPNLVRKERATA